ncbi:MAG: hypothetical protein ACLTT4_17650 [Coprobacillus cateniformis]
MNNMSYEIIKEMLIEDYNDFIEIESYSIKQAIAALLEDSVIMMNEDINNYISVIVILAKISLESNIIPNYILERFTILSDDMIKLYKYKEIPEFINDTAYIDNKLKKKNIEIIDDEYKERVNILLGNN